MQIPVLVLHEDELDVSQKIVSDRFYTYTLVPRSLLLPDALRLFSLLWQRNKAKLFVTVGSTKSDWRTVLKPLPPFVLQRWTHNDTVDQFVSDAFKLLEGRYKKSSTPLISVLTTTFHSGEKLKRPLESLRAQSYNNWEWVIWDDSKDETTWKQLCDLSLTDLRIRVYRAVHCGFIGEMKRRSGSLCQGDWIVELDHDDLIRDDLFEKVVKAGEAFPNAGFIYSDYHYLFEEDEKPYHFGDFACFGYGWYFKQWSRGKLHYVKQSQSLNPVTASHIIGVPNHVRIWKRRVYEAIDRHCEQLAVADDYELLLRTFIYDCDWVRIPELMYLQYHNSGRSNFTIIRNGLIQHLVKMIWLTYHPAVNGKFSALGYAPYKRITKPNWEMSEPDYPRYEKIYTEYDRAVLMIASRESTVEQIEKGLEQVFGQTGSFHVYFVGHPKSPLGKVGESWIEKSPQYARRFSMWDFTKIDGGEWRPELWVESSMHHLLNYGLKIGVRTRWVEYYIVGEADWTPDELSRRDDRTGDWLLGQTEEMSSFSHKTELLESKGYWREGETPIDKIKEWENM